MKKSDISVLLRHFLAEFIRYNNSIDKIRGDFYYDTKND